MTKAKDHSLIITHQPDRQRLVAEVDGHENVVDYRLDGNVMRVMHTGVHPSLRGRGIAAALVDETLQFARIKGVRVDPVCSYVRAYMKRHPDTQDLLV